jgi:hypothetical protein
MIVMTNDKVRRILVQSVSRRAVMIEGDLVALEVLENREADRWRTVAYCRPDLVSFWLGWVVDDPEGES